MNTKNHTTNQHSESHGSTTSYVIGFFLSLILTFSAYLLVVNHLFDLGITVTILIILAMLQLTVQLFAFLHLGQEKKPRWNLVFFLLTAMTILTVVLGALWIMQHLNANMMPEKVEEYLIQDEGLKTESRSPYR